MAEYVLKAASLLRLMQLVSPALPIGSFHFSQGLEYAIHERWVHDETSARAWIAGMARGAIGTLDLPVLARLHRAWCDGRIEDVERWTRFIVAARETAELRAEDRDLGRALARVLVDLGIVEAQPWGAREATSFVTLFALASVRWSIDSPHALCAYLWSWSETQVLAAVKTIPLGQSAGQRMLDAMIGVIPEIAAAAGRLPDEDIGAAAPLQLIASAAHETQYSRLYRS